jgi:hypothetical protein
MAAIRSEGVAAMLTYLDMARLVLNVVEELDQYDHVLSKEDQAQAQALFSVVNTLKRKIECMQRISETHEALTKQFTTQLNIQCPHPLAWRDDDVFELSNQRLQQCRLCNDAVPEELPF